ncbi:MAG: hypothetical protein ACOH5I_09435 [Oligoflexus sp.]
MKSWAWISVVFLLTVSQLACQPQIRYQKSTATQESSSNNNNDSIPDETSEEDIAPQEEAPEEPQIPAGNAAAGPATGQVVARTLIVPPVQTGRYQPNRLQAIWVTDMNNQRIRSLDANPGRRPQHLRQWRVANAAQVDGFTGATITAYNPEPVEIMWDLLDQNNSPVNFGNYKLWFEQTQSNTNDNFQDGDPGYAVYSLMITVSPDGFSVTDNNHPAFTNIEVNHTP